ncbi:hypothetical protein E2562_003832 [Oryza meyeriana var. granulata]|uniref:Uncharacterized protein n=1 Tax=Oryza meyeriana var. granulata TaxID=110450 RepID=A0A6G1CX92_9ORYZ|nr:hypothetical protein E2562_003832 [Oryza meyeriana var. granulata]
MDGTGRWQGRGTGRWVAGGVESHRVVSTGGKSGATAVVGHGQGKALAKPSGGKHRYGGDGRGTVGLAWLGLLGRCVGLGGSLGPVGVVGRDTSGLACAARSPARHFAEQLAGGRDSERQAHGGGVGHGPTQSARERKGWAVAAWLGLWPAWPG